MSPSISVVLPAYNRFRMLVLVLDSIIAQTVPVREILVIDDGSTDETQEQMPRYLAERPERREKIRYIRQHNQGQSASLNRGITEARGDWIAFSSHDDIWLPWKLEWQLRAAATYGDKCGLCFTDATFINNPHMKQTVFQFAGSTLDGIPTGVVRNPIDLVTGRHPVWTQTVIVRKELSLRAGNYDPYMRYSEDHDFLFRLALLTEFCYVNLPLVLIDRSPADVRHTGEAENWHRVEFCLDMDQHRFETQVRMSGSLPGAIQKRVRRNLADNHSHWANLFLERNEFDKARDAMQSAVSYDPSSRLICKQMLVTAAPRLARSVFIRRDRQGAPRYDRVSWRSTDPTQG